ncbi:quinone-dependent dihydroorotate dehydrogenase [Rubrivirga sp.]|uniref:quinone-dependent dihydroorotate dehydrogenase n=1 Tax=Rubrivirga sp. TaxID=1885344 RepID=UPI003C75EA78
MYRFLRPLLFRLDAEDAHSWGVRAARLGQRAGWATRRLNARADPRLAQTVWGRRFRSPLGLAAGFDKNAELVRFWAELGFGFAEVGSVSALPSVGNARPRAFRLPSDGALVNRMGLNNDGADAVAERLASTSRPPGFVVGVNVAKTHSPDILGDAGIEDFRHSVRVLAPHADYLAINVSCPNTAEGKTFETPDALDALLHAIALEVGTGGAPPVVVKWSPPATAGIDVGAMDELVEIALGHGVRGFITSNTASDRDGLVTGASEIERIGNGGLSGRPLAARSKALTRHLYRTTDGTVPIVGVGGIDSAEEAYERVRAGASLLQVYTGLVYQGPGLVGQIHRGLIRLLDRDGLDALQDAVGADA